MLKANTVADYTIFVSSWIEKLYKQQGHNRLSSVVMSGSNNKIFNSNNFDKPPEVESSTNNLNGISDFNAVEMGGAWSDKYSFIQDNPSPMSFCYQFLDSMKDNQITGQPSNSNSSNNSQQMGGQGTRRSSGMENRLQQLQQERDNLFPVRR